MIIDFLFIGLDVYLINFTDVNGFPSLYICCKQRENILALDLLGLLTPLAIFWNSNKFILLFISLNYEDINVNKIKIQP